MEINHLWNNGELILDKPELAIGEEPFIDIKIITLKAHLESLAIDKALEKGASLSNINEIVNDILIDELNSSKEFIHVYSNEICVGINCEIIDENVILEVWELLSRQQDLRPGVQLEIGEIIQVYDGTQRTN